jgi:YVTN family beta-propeller protein
VRPTLAALLLAVVACSSGADGPAVGTTEAVGESPPAVDQTSSTVRPSTTATPIVSTTTTTTSTRPPTSPSGRPKTTSTTSTSTLPPTVGLSLEEALRITGDISPKSIVASGDGYFMAQNMMYRHTLTVYDAAGELVATIPDEVDLAAFGHEGFGNGTHRGAPVEAAFTSDARHAYVSNYQMYGEGFGRPGDDGCGLAAWDESFLYRVDTSTWEIDQAIAVGAVPKYVAVTPDDRLALVTNWCSFDLSVVDTASAMEIARVPLGRHPRGIAVSPDGDTAYVAIMGSRDVAVVDLDDLSTERISGVGANPRHVVLSPDGRTLYVSLNGEGRIAAVDVARAEVVGKVATASAPRSMAISTDGASLYVVNYLSDTLSKVRTDTMEVVQEVDVAHRPIGITYDPLTGQVWVSSYSGSITVFVES